MTFTAAEAEREDRLIKALKSMKGPVQAPVQAKPRLPSSWFSHEEFGRPRDVGSRILEETEMTTEELWQVINSSEYIDTSGDPDKFIASVVKQGEIAHKLLSILGTDVDILMHENYGGQVLELLDDPDVNTDLVKQKRVLELAKEFESTRPVLQEWIDSVPKTQQKGASTRQMSEEAKAADEQLTQASTNPEVTARAQRASCAREGIKQMKHAPDINMVNKIALRLREIESTPDFDTNDDLHAEVKNIWNGWKEACGDMDKLNAMIPKLGSDFKNASFSKQITFETTGQEMASSSSNNHNQTPPAREIAMAAKKETMQDQRLHESAANSTGKTGKPDPTLTGHLEDEIFEINLRLEEFSKTHGAVLLGMHRELSSLKSDVTAQLSSSTLAIDNMANQMQGEQVEVLDFVKKALKETVENINKKTDMVMAEFKAKSSDTLSQAEILLGKINNSAIDGLKRIEDQTRVQKDSLVSIKDDFSERTQKLLESSQSSLRLNKKELDENNARIVTYVSVQQRLLDEQAEELKKQRQIVINQQTGLDKKIAEHQQRVEHFNSTTRKLSIASLALLTGLILWYGANQWLH